MKTVKIDGHYDAKADIAWFRLGVATSGRRFGLPGVALV